MPIYPALNGTNMSQDLTYIFAYANQVTYGTATMFICIAFFMVIFLTSLFAQQRATGTMRPNTALLAASFVTFGFEIIMLQKHILSGWFFFMTCFVLLLSILWVVNSAVEN